MHIPPFPLPSNLRVVVHFRIPNVNDGLLFAELNPNQEEALTTQYLNHLQDKDKNKDGKVLDSGEWTGEDRRTALWWIYIASRDSTVTTFSYECSACNDTHYLEINLSDLGDTSCALSVKPSRDITFYANSIEYKATVSPITGFAAEHIETLRNIRDMYDENSLDYRKASNEMVINELLHSLSVAGQPDDHEEALTWKRELVSKMALDTEYRALCAQVEQELRALRHGLLTQYNNGRYSLITEHDNCEKAVAKGENSRKLLLLPFRNLDFISTI